MRPLYLCLLATLLFPIYNAAAQSQFGEREVIVESAPARSTLLIADFDGDGDNDLFSEEENNEGEIPLYTYYLMVNDGEENFEDVVIKEDRTQWTQVKSADINADGRLDLVVFQADLQKIGWLRNNGDGNFGWRRDIIKSGSLDYADFTVANLDQDSLPELILSVGDSLGYIKNIDGEAFAEFSTLLRQNVDEFVPSDIDQDGLQDITVLIEDSVKVIKNQGEGAFATYQQFEIENQFFGAEHFRLYDMDADGYKDILISEGTSCGASFVRFHTFLVAEKKFDVSPVSIGFDKYYPQNLEPTDVDGDGDTDLLISDEDEDCSDYGTFFGIYWIENINAWESTEYHRIINDQYGSFADLDADGDFDVLFYPGSPHGKRGLENVWIENIDFTKNEYRYASIGNIPLENSYIRDIGDISGDSIKELIISSDFVISSITLNKEENKNELIKAYAIQEIFNIEIADVNGDGKEDIIAVLVDEFDNVSVVWYSTKDNFEEHSLTNYVADYSIDGKHPSDIFVGDIDGDGDNDIYTGPAPSLYINNGVGNFEPLKSSFDDINKIYALKDLNGDNYIDILSQAGLYFNDGKGNFTKASDITGDEAVDLDGDGDMDILMLSYRFEEKGWYENDGEGNFSARQALDIPEDRPYYFLDVDNDRDADLLAGGDNLTWYENTDGKGNFAEGKHIDTIRATALTAGDIDNDGDLDVIAGGEGFVYRYDNLIINKIPNQSPANISLSNDSMAENQPAGAKIGIFTTDDADSADTHTYSLIAGAGDTDNGNFNSKGDTLYASTSFDYEQKKQYSIRVQTDDGNGGMFAKTFTIKVTDVADDPNTAPFNLTLSNQTVNENVPQGTVIGTLSAEDADGDVLSFMLIDSANTNNDLFEIAENKLLTRGSLDYEKQQRYTIHVQADDNKGGKTTKSFTIIVHDVDDDANNPPTAIVLSAQSIAEGLPAGSIVGVFLATDADRDTITFKLIAGEGSSGNASFMLAGDTLKSAAVFDYEAKASYSILVRVDDGKGGILEQVFMINITDQPENQAPTALNIDGKAVDENQPAGTLVGTLTATDPDAGDTLTYQLIEGEGDADNAVFSIEGNQLLTQQVLDYETKSTYSIRGQVSDGKGGVLAEVFTISVNDLKENSPPTVQNPIADQVATQDKLFTFTIPQDAFSDPDAGDALSYTASLGNGNSLPTWLAFDAGNRTFSGTPTRQDTDTLTITVTAKDQDGATVSDDFTLAVEQVTGIEDEQARQVNIYPVPVGGHEVTVAFGHVFSSNYQYRILSMEGKVIKTGQASVDGRQTSVIDISLIPTGKYLLEIKTRRETIRKNMIVR